MKYIALLFALTAFTTTAQATELIVLPKMVITASSVESCRSCQPKPATLVNSTDRWRDGLATSSGLKSSFISSSTKSQSETTSSR